MPHVCPTHMNHLFIELAAKNLQPSQRFLYAADIFTDIWNRVTSMFLNYLYYSTTNYDSVSQSANFLRLFRCRSQIQQRMGHLCFPLPV